MDTLPRSFLFVPCDQVSKIEKAWRLRPDCIVLDLEDGVAESHKAIARQNLRYALETMPPDAPRLLVRVNSDPCHRRADMEAAAHRDLFALVVPKCKVAEEIVEIAQKLSHMEEQMGSAAGTIKLFLLIESARGLLQLPSFAAASERVVALVFGAEDWCLDMGMVRTRGGEELEIARWNISVCARAHGLMAVDTVYADFHDTEGLLRDTSAAKRLGFTGKLAIHPQQLEPIRSVFEPSEKEIAEAEAVVRAFDRAEAQGQAIVTVNNLMVDKPVAERARALLVGRHRGR